MYLALMSGGGGDTGGITGGKSAKPVTPVQVCVSAFVNITPLDTFRETSGQFPAVFVVTKPGALNKILRHLQLWLW